VAYEHSEGWGAASMRMVIFGGLGRRKDESHYAKAHEITRGYAKGVDGVNKSTWSMGPGQDLHRGCRSLQFV
jgi:hypothetical protein